jgi:hypothetical protein
VIAVPSPRDRVSTLHALLDIAERFVTNRDHSVTTAEMEQIADDVARHMRRDALLVAAGDLESPVLTALEKLLVDVLVLTHERPRNGSSINQKTRRRLLSLAGELLPDAREAYGRALDARSKGYE